MAIPHPIFDRCAVRHHRDRAARRYSNAVTAHNPEFLHEEITDRLLERLGEVRKPFADCLYLGCRHAPATRRLAARKDLQFVVQVDFSPSMTVVARADNRFFPTLCVDEEYLPFVEGCFDLVFAPLSLHWVNDLPGALIQIRRLLRPDGLLLAALFGGATLCELREALGDAELSNEGGISPRVSPFADVRDGGDLLQRAGFALPVVDRERVTVTYEHAFNLMADLRHMGETNAVLERRKTFTRRQTLLDTADIYLRRFADKSGRLEATFEVIYLTGWAPAGTQPKPLRPGSATVRLANALNAEERDPGAN
ncbi:MAG: methyltransferase domain-containing protein [Rhodospirillaceae bacterium]|nr:methyltransferase domain-containing protein [Rhodospirillaceae bacterium]MCY4237314.1 methyltransferase domain-containing protein [Rhodospirillaceae bacterium]